MKSQYIRGKAIDCAGASSSKLGGCREGIQGKRESSAEVVAAGISCRGECRLGSIECARNSRLRVKQI